jgi:hypothetical protein
MPIDNSKLFVYIPCYSDWRALEALPAFKIYSNEGLHRNVTNDNGDIPNFFSPRRWRSDVKDSIV